MRTPALCRTVRGLPAVLSQPDLHPGYFGSFHPSAGTTPAQASRLCIWKLNDRIACLVLADQWCLLGLLPSDALVMLQLPSRVGGKAGCLRGTMSVMPHVQPTGYGAGCIVMRTTSHWAVGLRALNLDCQSARGHTRMA